MTELERVAFFNGQSLTAEDMNLERANERTLRWLHNRTLHDWGIASGFGVTGRRGDRSVTVDPGIALDSQGRELILASSVVKPIPVVSNSSTAAKYNLVARYVEDADQAVLETRSGVCASGGAVRLSDAPSIEWRTTANVKTEVDIILATVSIDNCKLSKDVSGASRRIVRPSTQPHIASGRTGVAATVWTPMLLLQVTVGFSVAVSTLAADFAEVPEYTAHIAGDRYFAPAPGPLFAAPVVSIVNATRTGFTLQAYLPQGSPGSKINPLAVRDHQEGPIIFHALGWHVVWMGVEG